MVVMLKLASSMGDVLNLILGEGFTTPTPQAMEQYPNLFIR